MIRISHKEDTTLRISLKSNTVLFGKEVFFKVPLFAQHFAGRVEKEDFTLIPRVKNPMGEVLVKVHSGKHLEFIYYFKVDLEKDLYNKAHKLEINVNGFISTKDIYPYYVEAEAQYRVTEDGFLIYSLKGRASSGVRIKHNDKSFKGNVINIGGNAAGKIALNEGANDISIMYNTLQGYRFTKMKVSYYDERGVDLTPTLLLPDSEYKNTVIGLLLPGEEYYLQFDQNEVLLYTDIQPYNKKRGLNLAKRIIPEEGIYTVKPKPGLNYFTASIKVGKRTIIKPFKILCRLT